MMLIKWSAGDWRLFPSNTPNCLISWNTVLLDIIPQLIQELPAFYVT
jgi:hypothetical protein